MSTKHPGLTPQVRDCLDHQGATRTFGLVATRFRPLADGQALRAMAQHVKDLLTREEVDDDTALKSAWSVVARQIDRHLRWENVELLAASTGPLPGLDPKSPYFAVLQQVAQKGAGLDELEQSDLISEACADARNELIVASRTLSTAILNARQWTET